MPKFILENNIRINERSQGRKNSSFWKKTDISYCYGSECYVIHMKKFLSAFNCYEQFYTNERFNFQNFD